MERPERKAVRLKGYNYNTPGYYFITICTEGKKKLLCDIVGTVLPDGPKVRFTQYGMIAYKQLEAMRDFYDEIKLEKYVIMPNHVHLLLHIPGSGELSGRMGPTVSKVGRFVGSFKRFCNREYGHNIWQSRSHDHVIRGERDYLKIWDYIETNPARWKEDCFYMED